MYYKYISRFYFGLTVLVFSLFMTGIVVAQSTSSRRIQAGENLYVGGFSTLSSDPRVSSTPKQNVPFALPAINLFVDHSSGEGPILVDVNGDGLQDLVFSKLTGSILQFVLLNTGDGYEMAYGCYVNPAFGGGGVTQEFRGDCADI